MVKTILLTGLALIAFAANSVLCRMALKEGAIDAAGFTVVRMLSGALVLLLIIGVTRKKNLSPTKGGWISGVLLFLYAVTFSFAYMTLGTGTGALILFGSVQVTMILLSLYLGDRLKLLEWAGVAFSVGDFRAGQFRAESVD